MANKVKVLEQHLANIESLITRLEADVVRHEGEEAAGIEKRREALLTGKPDARTLHATDDLVARAERGKAAVLDALEMAHRQKADAEQKLSEARDVVERSAAAEKAHQTADAIEQAFKTYTAACAPLVSALAGANTFESNAIAGLVGNILQEVTLGVPQVTADLQVYAKRVVARQADIRGKKKQAPPAPPPTPVPPPIGSGIKYRPPLTAWIERIV